MPSLPTAATGAFASLVRRTPVVAAPALAARLAGADVRLKLECLQRTGSFKLRGAALRLDALSPEERAAGVVAASAGNHGLGVALAAAHLGVRAAIVVPATTPAVKRRGIEALGAEVLVEGGGYDAAERAARDLAATRAAVFVSPFDDPWVVRGNGGTLAEELLAQAPDVALVVCPVGGGGLGGGLAERLAPAGVAVAGVQPQANCAMRRSLEAGRALLAYDGEPTLAEGCEGAVAERTFALFRHHRVAVALVTEAAIRRAIAFAYGALGVVVEPSAAVAIAGLLEGAVTPASHGATIVVVSGGNVEPALLDACLGQGRIDAARS